MFLVLLWLRIRSPPTRHPAFGLPTDQSVMRDQMGASAKPPPLGFLGPSMASAIDFRRGHRIGPG
jgi:hypothetical protein